MRFNLAATSACLICQIVAVFAFANDSIGEEAAVTIKQTDQGFQFLSSDRPVLFYQSEPVTEHNHTRAGYVHPLYGLDGEMLTEVFPKDHRHHQGVFWAWHQLWVGDRKIGDPWVTKDHLLVVKRAEIVDQGPDFATLDVHAAWTSTTLNDSGESKDIVAERTQIRVHREVGDIQYVDFTIQLTPLMADVKVGGSEDVKGYSGFTVRVKPPADMVIRDASGILEDDAIQSASPWADVSGSFGEGKTSGVAILSHPSLTQFPPRWVLRHYGMQNVAYPGREPIALSADEPLVIRHRLVLHRGDAQAARVADHQRTFEMTP
ncbi:MAG: PmoA family protein [Planctomycetaceae bacterium]|nr:PmoA family protein [Planctomycetales bacterium]MCB9874464.1 PmoA family protein [Planctomycetaceae bacterium]MCB9940959.1 PmoA family protein [Planctomycetaceae bacterium]